MRSHRHGSILLFALGVVTVLTVLCYGFLHAVIGQRGGSRAATMQSLARRSAEAGAQHALEQILRDHLSGQPTGMDSLAMASFRAHDLPFSTYTITATPSDSSLIDLHDVAPENFLYQPAWCRTTTAQEYKEWGGSHLEDQQIGAFAGPHDGRGRWIEPGLYAFGTPLALLSGGNTWRLPSLPVRFGDDDGRDVDGPARSRDGGFGSVRVLLTRPDPDRDVTVNVRDVLAPAGSAMPGVRCQPLLLDKDLRRLPYSDATGALQARQEARYRLRYACMVRDLDGLFQINPDPRLDWRAITSPDPGSYADPDLARVVRYLHAVQNVVLPMTRFDNEARLATIGPRAEHVYLGRGSTLNYATVAGDATPRTFPFMFRQAGTMTRFMGTWYDNNNWRTANHRSNPQPIPADSLFGPTPSVSGGVALPANATTTWRHDLLGPQSSFFNASLAMRGTSSDSLSDNRNLEGDFHPFLWMLSPFGTGLRTDRGGRYQAAVDTPWHLNLLTAHPIVLRGLLIGSMPSGAVGVRYVAKPTTDPIPANNRLDPTSTDYESTTRGINDLWNAMHSPAFEHYAPPSANGVTPNYRARAAVPGEIAYRNPEDRYPGPLLFNGIPPGGDNRTAVSDGIGALIDVSDRAAARDPHADYDYVGLVSYSGGRGVPYPAVAAPSDIGWSAKDTANDPNPDDKDSQTRATLATPRQAHWDRFARDYQRAEFRLATNSYWRDIGWAFNAAVAVARRGHARFEGCNYQPISNDIYQTSPVARPASIAEFDRLFLICLGHDPENPAAAPPVMGSGKEAWGGNPPVRYTPNRNLFTANAAAVLPDITVLGHTATATHRTQAAELAVNDFRFSLFGSSPDYSLAFRPLDLNGDGRVAFSGYAANRPGLSDDAAQAAFRIDEDSVVVANGQGEWPSDSDGDGRLSLAEFRASRIEPFCMTGNLFIGRSRYWHVIVRGELWDNVLRQQASQATLETVFLIDQTQEGERANAQQQYSSQVVFQRWHHNLYQGLNRRND